MEDVETGCEGCDSERRGGGIDLEKKTVPILGRRIHRFENNKLDGIADGRYGGHK